MADYSHLPLTKQLVCEAMEFVKLQTAAQLVLLAGLLAGCAGTQYVAVGEGGGAVEVRLTSPAVLSVDIDGTSVYHGMQKRPGVTIGSVAAGDRILHIEADAPGGTPVVKTDTVSVIAGQTTILTLEVPQPSPAWGFAAGIVAATFIIVLPLL